MLRAVADCPLSIPPVRDQLIRSARVSAPDRHRLQPVVGCQSGGTGLQTRGSWRIAPLCLSDLAASLVRVWLFA